MPQQVRTFPSPAAGTDFSITIPSIAGASISCTANGTTALTSAALFGSVFPGMKISGPGLAVPTTVLTITSPSAIASVAAVTAGSEPQARTFSYDLPFWKLRSFHAKLTTSATVANRDVKIYIDDGTNPAWMVGWGIAQTATVVTEYCLADGACMPAAPTASYTMRHYPLPPNLLLKPGWRIRAVTGAIDTTDAWTEIVMVVEEMTADIEPSYLRGAR